jgi:hypothetical protein
VLTRSIKSRFGFGHCPVLEIGGKTGAESTVKR